MIKTILVISAMLVGSASAVSAQDSGRQPAPRTVDTMQLIDTSQNARPERFKNIAKKYDEAKLEARRRAAFSFGDTVTSWFGSARYDQKPLTDRFSYQNDGDYFRNAPQFFALPYQEVPMRTTVAAYGLPGNRLTLAPGGHAVTPFEHVPVHDGMVDMNDLTDALDDHAYVIPGPIGLLYGGDQTAGALITRTDAPTSTDPKSALIVDKGDYGYAQTRGRLTKLFGDGRRFAGSVEYRKTDGIASTFTDDAYQYAGDYYMPLGANSAISSNGWMYTRDGSIAVNPKSIYSTVPRYRFERHLDIAYLRFDTARTSRLAIGYRLARQGSHMDHIYHQWFDQTAHIGYLKREWNAGSTLFRGAAEVEMRRYGTLEGHNDRTTANVEFSALRQMSGWNSAATIGSRYVKTYKSLPYALLTTLHESTHSFLHFSAGYLEAAPTQHQLYSPYTIALFDTASLIYADSGNSALSSEKQMILTSYGELGTLDNAVGASVAAGKINNAIDWVRLESGDSVTHTPANVDLTFYDIAGTVRFRITDAARFNAGLGFQHLTRGDNRPQYFVPDFTAHSGLELHWFWKSKDVHFYAYGQLTYVGKYEGYTTPELGDQVTASGRLSFEMGPFRFNYDVHNTTSVNYNSRDALTRYGRFVSYGFTWKFIN